MRLERGTVRCETSCCLLYTEWNKSIGKEEECPGDSSWASSSEEERDRIKASGYPTPEKIAQQTDRQTDRQTERVNRNGMANF